MFQSLLHPLSRVPILPSLHLGYSAVTTAINLKRQQISYSGLDFTDQNYKQKETCSKVPKTINYLHSTATHPLLNLARAQPASLPVPSFTFLISLHSLIMSFCYQIYFLPVHVTSYLESPLHPYFMTDYLNLHLLDLFSTSESHKIHFIAHKSNKQFQKQLVVAFIIIKT